MALKENDFVEITYTGMTKDDGIIFDTNVGKAAVENGLAEKESDVKPAVICLGKGQILKGIDKNLIGKEIGEHEFDIPPEDAFGKKDAKLIQLIPSAKFKKQNIKPEVGLNVEVDNNIGTIRAVTGGRTIVDFNHPLSGKEVHYKVKVERMVTDKAEQVRSILGSFMDTEKTDIKVEEDKAQVTMEKEMPKEAAEFMKATITEMTGLKDVVFNKLEKNKKNSTINDPNKEVKD